MILLSDVPGLPPEDELRRLQSAFFTSFKHHIFVDAIEVAALASPIPPYLQFALASLSAVASSLSNSSSIETEKTPADTSAGLFVAGVNLWSVMLEVDNREARLFEAVFAVSISSLNLFEG